MAYKTGVPQSELAARFDYTELMEVNAYLCLKYKERDKEDYRLAMLLYHLVATHSDKSKVGLLNIEKFVPNWGGEAEKYDSEARWREIATAWERRVKYGSRQRNP